MRELSAETLEATTESTKAYLLEGSYSNMRGSFYSRRNEHVIMVPGGGTGLRGILAPTAPGVWSPHQPPS